MLNLKDLAARGIDIPAAGIDKIPAPREAVRRLAKNGLTRIVLLSREGHRKPRYGRFVRAFLEELENQGVPAGSYNVPALQP